MPFILVNLLLESRVPSLAERVQALLLFDLMGQEGRVRVGRGLYFGRGCLAWPAWHISGANLGFRAPRGGGLRRCRRKAVRNAVCRPPARGVVSCYLRDSCHGVWQLLLSAPCWMSGVSGPGLGRHGPFAQTPSRWC